jgi:hypothetical protein
VTVACGARWWSGEEARLAGAIGAGGTARWASLIATTDASPSGAAWSASWCEAPVSWTEPHAHHRLAALVTRLRERGLRGLLPQGMPAGVTARSKRAAPRSTVTVKGSPMGHATKMRRTSSTVPTDH